jgi:hypothetical protein
MAALKQAGLHQLIDRAPQRVAIDAKTHGKNALRRQTVTGRAMADDVMLQLTGNLGIQGFSGIAADGVKAHMVV